MYALRTLIAASIRPDEFVSNTAFELRKKSLASRRSSSSYHLKPVDRAKFPISMIFCERCRCVIRCYATASEICRWTNDGKQEKHGRVSRRYTYSVCWLDGWLAGRPNVARVLDFRAGIKRSGKLDAKWSRA